MKLTDLPELKHLQLEGDFSGKSEAYYITSPQASLSLEDMKTIRAYLAKSPLSTVRLCFHFQKTDPVHEMIIFHKAGGKYPVHKHFARNESYQIIQGRLLVKTFGEDGKESGETILDSTDSAAGTLIKMGKNIWHSTIPDCDIVIFKETRPGPFDPADTLNAPWVN